MTPRDNNIKNFRAAPKMRIMHRSSARTPKVLFHTTKMGTCGRSIIAYYGAYPEGVVAALETSGFETEIELLMLRKIYAAYEMIVVVSDLTVESVQQTILCSECVSARGQPPRMFWNEKTIERIVKNETLWNLGTMHEPEDIERTIAIIRDHYFNNASGEALSAIWQTQSTLHTHAILHSDLRLEYTARVRELLVD